jgi:AraC-like DNA-binding protein
VDSISLQVTDPGQAEEACGRVYYPHRLTVLHEPSRFAMSLSALSLGPVAVGLLSYSGEVRLETAELETGYEINVPLSGQLLTCSGPAEVCASPGTAALYRPDRRTRLQGWADGGQLFGLKIERHVLEGRLAELAGAPVRDVIPIGPRLDLRTGAGQRWWILARALAALTSDPSGPISEPLVVRPLVESVLAALLYAADHPYRDALAASCARAGPAAVSRAVDLLEAGPEQPWTVGELARRAGVSTRALQYGFAAHTGISPMAYLRQVRLQRADADLRAARSEESVASIASRWGFTNFGRFAAAYRARYGRAPSVTLREVSSAGARTGSTIG